MRSMKKILELWNILKFPMHQLKFLLTKIQLSYFVVLKKMLIKNTFGLGFIIRFLIEMVFAKLQESKIRIHQIKPGLVFDLLMQSEFIIQEV